MNESSNDAAARWLGNLARLNPAPGRGTCRGYAPHKPLFLLALLDLVESGELPPGRLVRSPGLVLRFRSLGAIVAARWPTRLDLRMPFYHLHTQGFLEPFTAEGHRAGSPEICAACELDPEFSALLANPDFRLKARLLLTSKYFEPAEQLALSESLGLPEIGESAPIVGQVLAEAAEAARRKGRSALFKIRIVAEYRHVCALTGYRCFTDEGASIVDAAHIEGWAESGNDELSNGLALSKSAHWTFDEGLWSVGDDGRVIVIKERFIESGPGGLWLASYVGRSLQFDPDARLRPAAEAFHRHRRAHRIRV